MAKKLPSLTSPIVEWNWPWINIKKTKFNPEGEYSVDMIFESEDHPFLKKVSDIMSEHFQGAIQEAIESNQLKPAKAKAVKLTFPWKPEENAEGEETGRVVWTIKSKAVIKTKKGQTHEIVIRVFDSALKDVTGKKLKIGSGSRGRVSFTYKISFVKVTGNVHFVTYLNAVQIIELTTFGASGDSFGFGEESGGFNGDDYNQPEEENFETTLGETDDNDDDEF